MFVDQSLSAVSRNLDEVVPVHSAPDSVNIFLTLGGLSIDQVVEEHLSPHPLTSRAELNLSGLLATFIEAHIALLQGLLLLPRNEAHVQPTSLHLPLLLDLLLVGQN